MNQQLPKIKLGLPSDQKQKSKAGRDWHHPLRPMLSKVLKLQQICKPR